MIYRIFKWFLFLFIISIASCRNAGMDNEDNSFLFLMDFCVYSTDSSLQFSATDNFDGTITLTQAWEDTSSCSSKKTQITEQIVIKKCLQGQIYNSSSNDCTGTGDSLNKYGAIQYQLCTLNNDPSCYDNGDVITALSPARQSCIMDSFLGESWDLFESTGFNLYYANNNNSTVRIAENTSMSSSDSIWKNDILPENNYVGRYANITGFLINHLYTGTANTTETKYVLCKKF